MAITDWATNGASILGNIVNTVTTFSIKVINSVLDLSYRLMAWLPEWVKMLVLFVIFVLVVIGTVRFFKHIDVWEDIFAGKE